MNDVAAEPVEQDHVEAPVEAPEAEEVTIDPEEEKALSRGWKPKDAWVESGKNPDHHTNAKAFNMIRDAHEKNAEFKTIIEQVKTDAQKTREMLQKQHQEELARRDSQREHQIKQAVEEGDADQVQALMQEQLREQTNRQPQPTQAQGEQLPIVKAFRASNPQFLPGSPQYDHQATIQWEATLNNTFSSADELLQMGDDGLLKILSAAKDSTLGASKPPAKKPPAVQSPQRQAPAKRLDSESQNMYNRLKAMSGDGSSDHAEAFKKRMLARQGD